MIDDAYDLISIGGGTAGLVASQVVAGFGGRAAMIEADRPGGDCLWTGCVPSKALIATAKAAHTMRHADKFGLAPTEASVDLAQVMKSVQATQTVIEPHDSAERLEAEGVDVIIGRGRFVKPGVIQVADRKLRFRAALIATGSHPFVPPIEGLHDADPLTSDNVWHLEELPNRLVVLGGGPIGCELGQAFARLGSQVSIVEAAPTLVPSELAEVGNYLAERLKAEHISVKAGTMATAVTPDVNEGWNLSLDDGSTVPFDKILVATGRTPNSADLGLDLVDVETTDRGHIVVNDRMATTGNRIYAAGDVVGGMAFTHVAAKQARAVVGNALFRTRQTVDYELIPSVTFTDPEIGRIGLNAEQARERWGEDAIVQRFDLAKLDRAITERSGAGWVEVVGDPKRRLVGATVVGHNAGETLAEMASWMVQGAKIDKISTTVHAYPTMSEGPSRAADEVLRGFYFDPGKKRIAGAALSFLRKFDSV